MSNQDDEIRRLQRLRNEQLNSRDPTAKDRAKMQRISKRHHKSRQPFTLKRILRDLPAKWLLTLARQVLHQQTQSHTSQPGDGCLQAVDQPVLLRNAGEIDPQGKER